MEDSNDLEGEENPNEEDYMDILAQMDRLGLLFKYESSMSRCLRDHLMKNEAKFIELDSSKEAAIASAITLIRNQTFENLFVASKSVLTHYLHTLDARLYIVDTPKANGLWTILETKSQPTMYDDSKGLASKCVQTMQTFVCALENLDPEYLQPIDLEIRGTSEALVVLPIVQNSEKVVAVVEFLCNFTDTPIGSEGNKYFLELFCIILADVIGNCWENELLALRLQSANDELHMAKDLSHMYELINCEEIDQVFETVAAYAERLYAEIHKRQVIEINVMKAKLHLVDREVKEQWSIQRQNGQFIELRKPIDDGLVGRAIQRQSVEKNLHDSLINVCIPFVSSTKDVLGVLELTDMSILIDDSVMAKLQLFSNQIAVAIEQHMAHFMKGERWKKMNSSLHKIHLWFKSNEIPSNDLKSDVLRQMYNVVRKSIAELVPSDCILFYLIDISSQTLIQLSTEKHDNLHVPLNRGLLGHAISTGNSLKLNESVVNHTLYMSDVDDVQSKGVAKSYACVPLKRDSTGHALHLFDSVDVSSEDHGSPCVGAIVIVNTDSDRQFTGTQIELVEHFAYRMVHMLYSWVLSFKQKDILSENKRLSASDVHVSAHAKETASQLQQLSERMSLVGMLDQQPNLNTAMLEISNKLERKMKYERVTIFLMPSYAHHSSEDERQLTLWTPLLKRRQEGQGTVEEMSRLVLRGPDRGLPGLCVDAKIEVDASSVHDHGAFSGFFDMKTLSSTKSSLCIPLYDDSPKSVLQGRKDSTHLVGCIEFANSITGEGMTTPKRDEVEKFIGVIGSWIHKQLVIEDAFESVKHSHVTFSDRSRLHHEEMTQQAVYLTKLHELLASLSRSSNETELILTCKNSLGPVFGNDTMGHMFLLHDKESLWSLDSSGERRIFIDVTGSEHPSVCARTDTFTNAINTTGSILFAKHMGTIHNEIAGSIMCATIHLDSVHQAVQIPMLNSGVLGVLEVAKKSSDGFLKREETILQCVAEKLGTVVHNLAMKKVLENEEDRISASFERNRVEFEAMEHAEQQRIQAVEQHEIIKQLALKLLGCATQENFIQITGDTLRTSRFFDNQLTRLFIYSKMNKHFWTTTSRMSTARRVTKSAHEGILGEVYRMGSIVQQVYGQEAHQDQDSGFESLQEGSLVIATPCYSLNATMNAALLVVVSRDVIDGEKSSIASRMIESQLEFLQELGSWLGRQLELCVKTEAESQAHTTANETLMVREDELKSERVMLGVQRQLVLLLEDLACAGSLRAWIDIVTTKISHIFGPKTECFFYPVRKQLVSTKVSIAKCLASQVRQTEADRKSIVTASGVSAPVFAEKSEVTTLDMRPNVSSVVPTAAVIVVQFISSELRDITPKDTSLYEKALNEVCVHIGNSLKFCEDRTLYTKSSQWHIDQNEFLRRQLNQTEERIDMEQKSFELQDQMLSLVYDISAAGISHNFEATFRFIRDEFPLLFHAESACLYIMNQDDQHLWTLKKFHPTAQKACAISPEQRHFSDGNRRLVVEFDQGVLGNSVDRFLHASVNHLQLHDVLDNPNYAEDVDGASSKTMTLLSIRDPSHVENVVGLVQLINVQNHVSLDCQKSLHTILYPILALTCTAKLEQSKLRHEVSFGTEKLHETSTTLASTQKVCEQMTRCIQTASTYISLIHNLLKHLSKYPTAKGSDAHRLWYLALYTQENLGSLAGIFESRIYIRDKEDVYSPRSSHVDNERSMQLVSVECELQLLKQISAQPSQFLRITTGDASSGTASMLKLLRALYPAAFVNDAPERTLIGIAIVDPVDSQVYGHCVVIYDQISGSAVKWSDMEALIRAICTIFSVVAQYDEQILRSVSRFTTLQEKIQSLERKEGHFEEQIILRNHVLHYSQSLHAAETKLELFDMARKQVKGLLDCDTAHLYVLSEEGDMLESSEPSESEVDRLAKFPMSIGMLGRVLEEGQSLNLGNSMVLDDFTGKIRESAVYCPVKNKNDIVVGVVSALGKVQGEIFSQEDGRALEEYAVSVGSALEQLGKLRTMNRKLCDLDKEKHDSQRTVLELDRKLTFQRQSLLSFEKKEEQYRLSQTQQQNLLQFINQLNDCSTIESICEAIESKFNGIHPGISCKKVYIVDQKDKMLILQNSGAATFPMTRGLCGFAATTGEVQKNSAEDFNLSYDEVIDGPLSTDVELVCLPSSSNCPVAVIALLCSKLAFHQIESLASQMVSCLHLSIDSINMKEREQKKTQILMRHQSKLEQQLSTKVSEYHSIRQQSELQSALLQAIQTLLNLSTTEIESIFDQIQITLCDMLKCSECRLYLARKSDQVFEAMQTDGETTIIPFKQVLNSDLWTVYSTGSTVMPMRSDRLLVALNSLGVIECNSQQLDQTRVAIIEQFAYFITMKLSMKEEKKQNEVDFTDEKQDSRKTKRLKAKETKYEKLIETIAKLLQSQVSNWQDLMNIVAIHTRELYQCDGATLFLLDEGPYSIDRYGERHVSHDNLLQLVMRTERSLEIGNVDQDERCMNYATDSFQLSHPKSLLYLVISHRETSRLTAVLRLSHQEERFFNQESIKTPWIPFLSIWMENCQVKWRMDSQVEQQTTTINQLKVQLDQMKQAEKNKIAQDQEDMTFQSFCDELLFCTSEMEVEKLGKRHLKSFLKADRVAIAWNHGTRAVDVEDLSLLGETFLSNTIRTRSKRFLGRIEACRDRKLEFTSLEKMKLISYSTRMAVVLEKCESFVEDVELKQQNIQLLNEKSSHDVEMKRLREELDRMMMTTDQKEMKDLEMSKKEIEIELEEWKMKYKTLEEHSNAVTSQLHRIKQEKKEFEMKMVSNETKYEKIKTQYESLKDSIQQTRTEVEKLKEKKNKWKQECQASQRDLNLKTIAFKSDQIKMKEQVTPIRLKLQATEQELNVLKAAHQRDKEEKHRLERLTQQLRQLTTLEAQSSSGF